MDELKQLLDELEEAFTADPRHFKRTDRFAFGYFDEGVKPILSKVTKETRRLLDKQYSLSVAGSSSSGGNGLIDLVHYTTIESLVSILDGTNVTYKHTRFGSVNADDTRNANPRETSSIRLYDTEHFNDPDEGEYLIRSLSLHNKYAWLEARNTSHAYVASFIDARDKDSVRDNLVYWRTYGNGGQGCSIVLSIPRRHVRRVLYGQDGTRCTKAVIFLLLDKLDRIISKCKLVPALQTELSNFVWELLHPIRYLHKSDAYDYENECRVLVPWEDGLYGEVQFEYDASTCRTPLIRHYVERSELRASQVLLSGSCVTLGPRVSHRGSTRLLFETLLRALELPTEVRFSGIAYRETR